MRQLLRKWLRRDDSPTVAPEVIELRAVRDDLKEVALELQKASRDFTAGIASLRVEESNA